MDDSNSNRLHRSLIWHDRLSVVRPSDEERVWQVRMQGCRHFLGHSSDAVSLSFVENENCGAVDSIWVVGNRPECLVICLNFSGTATLRDGSQEQLLDIAQMAIFGSGEGSLEVRRQVHQRHAFLVLHVGRSYLCCHFGDSRGLRTLVDRFIKSAIVSEGLLVAPIPPSLLSIPTEMLHPPVSPPAYPGWYRGKILQILSQTIFPMESPEGTFFQQRTRKRVEQARALIDLNLTHPPSLEKMAEQIGCSRFHLSRIFINEAGMSIPSYLRMQRIKRAAELLSTGEIRVREAARQVGYRNVTSFKAAFLELIGCFPSAYAARRASAASSDSVT